MATNETVMATGNKPVVVSAKLNEELLQQLNIRLRADGYETVGQLLRDYAAYRFPKYSKDEQVERLLARIKDKGIRDPFTGETGSITFYENVDRQEFLDYLTKRYFQYPKHGRDMYAYWERWCRVFFTKPELIMSESPSVREWICGAMRRFAEFWDERYHDSEVRLLIDEIIKRYRMGEGVNRHNKMVLLASKVQLQELIPRILEIAAGDLGTIIRAGLFTGLRQTELLYLHQKPVCDKPLCDCESMHAIELPQHGLTWIQINRYVGQKFAYLTIIPTELFKHFRALQVVRQEDEELCTALLKSRTDGQVGFQMLRKIHYNVCLAAMPKDSAQLLQGRVNDVAARHYTMYLQDELAHNYKQAWEKFGVPIETAA